MHNWTARIKSGALIAVCRILVSHLLFILALAKGVLVLIFCAVSSTLTRLQGWQPEGIDILQLKKLQNFFWKVKWWAVYPGGSLRGAGHWWPSGCQRRDLIRPGTCRRLSFFIFKAHTNFTTSKALEAKGTFGERICWSPGSGELWRAGICRSSQTKDPHCLPWFQKESWIDSADRKISTEQGSAAVVWCYQN